MEILAYSHGWMGPRGCGTSWWHLASKLVLFLVYLRKCSCFNTWLTGLGMFEASIRSDPLCVLDKIKVPAKKEIDQGRQNLSLQKKQQRIRVASQKKGDRKKRERER